MILDANGKPFDIATMREPQTAHVAYLQREFDLHPARGLTPARLQQIMADAERGDLVGQIELADDMEERDAHLYAEMSKRRGAITSQAWSVEEPDKANAAEKALTAKMRDWIGEIEANANGSEGGFGMVIASMCDAMLKGFAPQEMVWSVQEGVLIPELTLQPQRWFTTSPDRRRFMLRSQRPSEGTPADTAAGLPFVMGEALQPYSWLMHTHPARNGYLARMSLARVLFWPYLFKNFSTRDLAEFLEIYGLPLRLGKYPAGASDEEKRRLLQAVTQIGHNAAGIIPQSMVLEFEAAAAGTDVPFATMMSYMDAAESKAILGQTLTASEGSSGTQALGKVHNEVRHDIRDADARMIEETVNRQLIEPMALLNHPGASTLRMPRLKLDTGEAEDITAYADALPKLVGIKMQIPVKWAHDKLRIPQPQDGEEVLEAPVPPPVVGASDAVPGAKPGDPPVKKSAKLSGQAAGAARRDMLDDLVDAAAGDWRVHFEPMIGPLLAEVDRALAAGETIAQFRARLPQLMQQMDYAPAGERMSRTTLQAILAGSADLNVD